MRLVFSTYMYIVYHCLLNASVHQSSMSYPLSIYSPNFLVERLHSGSEINLESPYRITVDETRRSEQINTRKWSGWAIINGNALSSTPTLGRLYVRAEVRIAANHRVNWMRFGALIVAY